MFACIRAFAVAVALTAATAAAQTPRTVLLEALTWPELRERIAHGATTVIVPVGGTEQNGPHMVLGKHNVRVRYLAERVATELGNAIVAPVVAYVPEGGVDPPTAHMRFPGTITVPSKVFEATLESAGRSFRLHGFRDVVFLGDHGGYQKELRVAADALNGEWRASAVRAHAIAEYYRATEVAWPAALREKGYRNEEIGTHAGLADTSLALAVDPALVRTDKLRPDVRPLATEGTYGDPRRASADLGRVGTDLIVAATVAAIRKATARP
ncbi:MAG TPA: creatininase family protein [Casimicrobiaceae bacterium]|nr:creatininase family protein [Casimicrobiaceae bacterium]